MRRPNSRRGFTILCVLMAVLIVGILTQQYFTADVPGGKPWHVTQRERAQGAVNLINLRTAESQFMMRTEGRRLPIQDLRVELDKLSGMAGGGRFFLDQREQLQSTITIKTRRFSERYGMLPRSR